MPFSAFPVSWYCKDTNHYLGIWPVGGDSFLRAIREIVILEKTEHTIDKIAVITDHDDEKAELERPKSIMNEFISNVDIIDPKPETFVNKKMNG